MAVPVNDDNFSIEDSAMAELCQCGRDSRVSLGKGQAVPGTEPGSAAGHFRNDPETVPFDLEQPAAAVEGLVAEGCQHRLDVRRHRAPWGIIQSEFEAGRSGGLAATLGGELLHLLLAHR
jgi:hypothetical protein